MRRAGSVRRDPPLRTRKVSAENIVIATGTRPARPDSVAFDDRTIIDSDGIIRLERVPRSMVVEALRLPGAGLDATNKMRQVSRLNGWLAR